MNIPLEQRGKSEPRTLETLSRDYERFNQGGSVLNKAKLYNNVIEQTLIDIPISQVSTIPNYVTNFIRLQSNVHLCLQVVINARCSLAQCILNIKIL
jgi:hypothetical protein